MAHRAGQRQALHHKGDRQHDVRDEEVAGLDGIHDGVHALKYGEPGAQDQRAGRGEQSPDIADLAVTERMPLVRRLRPTA